MNLLSVPDTNSINKNKLIEVVKEYRRDISFVPMPDMKELTGQEIDTRRWNISTFGRLYMASALPETVHKVLNIDCDTIIVDTIEPLWNTDMTGKVFGGMLECINDRYRRNVGKNDGDYYLNGGIVFLNLDEVRVGNYERKFTDYITKYGSSLAYLDQDVLNGVVEQEKKVKLPMRYNTLSIYFYEICLALKKKYTEIKLYYILVPLFFYLSIRLKHLNISQRHKSISISIRKRGISYGRE